MLMHMPDLPIGAVPDELKNGSRNCRHHYPSANIGNLKIAS
jgi:hypothetical protein